MAREIWAARVRAPSDGRLNNEIPKKRQTSFIRVKENVQILTTRIRT